LDPHPINSSYLSWVLIWREGPMTKSYDLVIRDGMIVDGTGAEALIADVAIEHGRIVAVGKVVGSGREEVDATNRIVTPGFVDIHTHYDGHVTWASQLTPSSQHGVTTVLMGNCGVGFAPCRPSDRSRLIDLMEGIEDIPEMVLTDGLPWNWESFPDYLSSIEQRHFDIDVAFQIPHAPLRVYAMGERAISREPATAQDIAWMRRLVREAVEAGAFGFSTSRSLYHQSKNGTLTPTYAASVDELAGIALGLADAGRGVIQLATDFNDVEADFRVMRRVMQACGRPLSVSLTQSHNKPDAWRRYLQEIEVAAQEGFEIRAQVSCRPAGVFLGLRLARNPFMRTAAYLEIAHLPYPERARQMRQPQVRACILAQMPGGLSPFERAFTTNFPEMYEFEGDYEPAVEKMLRARAAAMGIEPAALAYDILTADNGEAVLCFPAGNFVGNQVKAIETMISHERTVLGLGDAGAHLGLIFDASLTTYMIERWSNAGRGAIPIETVVKSLTSDTAGAVGLNDRGVIAIGSRADLNVIDAARLAVGRHELIDDLPAGGQRLHQPASGYDATIVAGEIVQRDGKGTGALPGRLVRSCQPDMKRGEA
jgi:N-acyl-D-aspartate/D-glutamate deacylase